jgi:hypothetical protein
MALYGWRMGRALLKLHIRLDHGKARVVLARALDQVGDGKECS